MEVLAYSDVYVRYQQSFKIDEIVCVKGKGKLDATSGKISLIADEIALLEDWRQRVQVTVQVDVTDQCDPIALERLLKQFEAQGRQGVGLRMNVSVSSLECCASTFDLPRKIIPSDKFRRAVEQVPGVRCVEFVYG